MSIFDITCENKFDTTVNEVDALAVAIQSCEDDGTDELKCSLAERRVSLATKEAAVQAKVVKPIAAAPVKSTAAPSYAMLPLTEFGNTERLLRASGNDLMYVEELNAWYAWNGVHWSPSSDTAIIELCKQVVRNLPAEASAIIDDKARSEFLSFAVKSQKASMVRSMEYLARGDAQVRVKAAELDKEMYLLGTRNGAVDLRTGVLLPPDRKARITTACAANFDPNATCPVFIDTVMGVFSADVEMYSFFQRLMGYTLMGNPKEDVLVIPFGSGSNGKSTVLGAIRDVLGGYARTADASTFLDEGSGRGGNAGGPREDVLRLRGARFVYVSEPSENSELKENLVKSMTGGDPMPARGVHAKTTIEVVPTWVPVMPTNHRPIIKGDDFAIWRRIMTVPFMVQFDKNKTGIEGADLSRADKLVAERDGILAWLVQGALEYQAKGLGVPSAVQTSKEEYKADMDLLADWLDTCCVRIKGALATNEELWESWQAYASARGELRFISSARSLGKRLANRRQFETFNTTYKGHGRLRGYHGILVKGRVPTLLDFFTEEAKDVLMSLPF